MSHSHEFSSKTKRLLLAFPLWITAWHVSPKTPAFQDRSCEAPGQRQIASRFIIHHPIYGRVSFEKSMKLSQKIHEFLLPGAILGVSTVSTPNCRCLCLSGQSLCLNALSIIFLWLHLGNHPTRWPGGLL